MPYGVSWGKYLTFMSCAMLSMFAGSQVVHKYYRPLDDFNKYVEREIQARKAVDEGVK